ncbi:MAG: Zn-dependent carboxypeptidase [Massilibacillus sp.]|jgi:carboxypeptidase Taq|nr:Zn-dependent carboxypeptidase [Massilibacillus sp.]
MTYYENLKKLKKINDQLKYYKTIEALMDLDQWSSLPKQGSAYRQQVAAFVAGQKSDLMATDEVKSLVDYFSAYDLEKINDYVEKGLIRNFLFRYNGTSRVPKEKLQKVSALKAVTTGKWIEAKEKSDYSIFKPYLEEVFILKKEIAGYIDSSKNPFEVLVNITDEGICYDEVVREFDKLKTGIKELLNKINNSDVIIDDNFLMLEQSPQLMEDFARELIFELGYNIEKGAFAKVPHAFTSFMGPKDARISTYSKGLVGLLFTYIHESGHAMYAYGGNDKVNEMNMFGGNEGGFHEAQSRFYENIIGRSYEYWKHTYPKLQQKFECFKGISLDDFYKAINKVQPNVKRTISDEVTYSLHPIIRFELEKELFEGSLNFDDLPKAWNDKYEEYLGIRPNSDAEGVLQDMHWAGDYIAYFQSYALGNIYDGQIRNSVLKDIPDFYSKIEKGDFKSISSWFEKNIYCYSNCLTSGELMKNLTGETLNADHFLKYLNDKYNDIYKFS